MKRLLLHWTQPISPYPGAVFRILFGGYLLIYFVAFWPHVALFFSNQGVGVPFLLPDIAPSPAIAWGVYLAYIVLLGFWTLGWKTRLTTPMVLLGFLYHYGIFIASSGCAYDRLIILFLFLLCFTQTDGVLSVCQPKSQQQVTAWPLRLIALQVALIYFGSGLYKAFNVYWLDGNLLYWTLIGPWGNTISFSLVNLPGALLILKWINYGVILFELLMGAGLYWPRSRSWAIGLGLLFHPLIAILLSIPQFLLMCCTYVLFIKPVQLEKGYTQIHKQWFS